MLQYFFDLIQIDSNKTLEKVLNLDHLMISLDRKVLLFLISNSISIALGFLLYLVIISSQMVIYQN